MDCYDTRDCPGDCDVCPYYEEMLVIEQQKRKDTLIIAALVCFMACVILVWLATHFAELP